MKKIYLLLFGLVAAAAALLPSSAVHAQSPCAHVTFRLDTAEPLDQQAVCRAAEPWNEQGIRIFVYLTDVQPASEDEWFALLDRVEAEAGFRDLSQSDVFSTNLLALEASTANAPFAATLTYGERLFDTPLDRNEGQRIQLASDLRDAIRDGRATEGFTQTLTAAYALNYPPPPPPSPLLRGAQIVIILLVLGGIGYVGYRQVVQPAQARARHRRQLQAQIGRLQTGIANLLLALERLLAGDTPQDTVLYQLFEAYGGTHYSDRQTAVIEWLRRSQAALRQAFDVRRRLQNEEAQKSQSLEEQVRNWETVYLTLVGSSPRIRDLTEEELRDLLDPLVVLERHEQDVQLVQQLDAIRRQLEGAALKVELTAVDPTQADQEGILGYIDQIEEQLAELMEAREAAPDRLDDARRQRLAAEEAADSATPFGLTTSDLFGGIDKPLTTATNDLAAGIYLRVLDTADAVIRDLEIIEDLIAAAADHAGRQPQIDTIISQGYRPTTLATDREEIAEDIENIRRYIRAGDYLTADDWIDELDADSARALAAAEAWPQQHQANQAALAELREKIGHYQAYLNDEANPAWETLKLYPPGNWANVTSGPDAPAQTLHRLNEVVLPQIEYLNSMPVQQLDEARQLLVQGEADAALAQRQIQAIVDRLAEVQAAETHIAEGIRLAEADLAQAVAFRDAEDPKIGPEVDRQLVEAAEQIEQARRLATQREFIAAMHAQESARSLATAAYAAASEQVQKINALQAELAQVQQQAARQVDSTLAEGETLSPLAQTAETYDLLQQASSQISTARQAEASAMSLEDHELATALSTAVAAFNAARQLAEQAQKRITADRQAYNQLRDEAQAQIRRAQNAVNEAAARVSHRDAGRAGDLALQRARAVLPSEQVTINATREALQQAKLAADQAYDYAREAKRKAEQAIQETQARRAAVWTWTSRSSGWSGGRSSGGSWSSPSRSSNRSTSRPSWSSGSSSRSSSGSSSRRSVSSGSSSRSSFSGGSRRSSSGGRSRR